MALIQQLMYGAQPATASSGTSSGSGASGVAPGSQYLPVTAGGGLQTNVPVNMNNVAPGTSATTGQTAGTSSGSGAAFTPNPLQAINPQVQNPIQSNPNMDEEEAAYLQWMKGLK
jgi:hypothetical protein